MAQQSLKMDAVKWKPGTKCDLYDRSTLKWVEAEIIGSLSDENGEWIKVRWDQKDRNVKKGDPDLRPRAVIPGHELKQLQDAAAQLPNIAPILQRVLPTSSGQGLYTHSDGLFTFCIQCMVSARALILRRHYNTERMTWFKVVNCVNNELFPVLSIALKKCIDEKLSEDNNFEPHDFGDVVIEDIMERLKGERTMNNKEMKYLKELFQRAIEFPVKSSVYNVYEN